MKAIKIHETTKKIQQLVKLSKQALREGAYRVASRLHAVVLSMEGKRAPQNRKHNLPQGEFSTCLMKHSHFCPRFAQYVDYLTANHTRTTGDNGCVTT